MIDHRQRCAGKGESTEIRPGELMALWVYDKKFLADMQFLFGTLSFTTGEDDNLEHSTQEQEERRTMTIDLGFTRGTRGLKNSATTFQQPATVDLIDGLARPLIETPSTTT
jgi:hypothetical protein